MNLDENEGPTDFDRRHNFVFSGSAMVPRTGGLTVSTVVRALSGRPFTRRCAPEACRARPSSPRG